MVRQFALVGASGWCANRFRAELSGSLGGFEFFSRERRFGPAEGASCFSVFEADRCTYRETDLSFALARRQSQPGDRLDSRCVAYARSSDPVNKMGGGPGDENRCNAAGWTCWDRTSRATPD